MARIFLYSFIFGIMAFVLFYPFSEENAVQLHTFSHYYEKSSHVLLLNYYLETYNYPQVYRELALLESLGYGFNNDVSELRRKYFIEIGALADMETELDYWKQFLARYPGYRDGWLELSGLYYQHYNLIEARLALINAFHIDPLLPLVKQYDLYYQ